MKKVLFILMFALTSVISNVQAKNSFDQTMLSAQDSVVNVLDLLDSVNPNDSTPYIIKFYDIERIVINNKYNHLIRIYDERFNLICQTRKDVNKSLKAGSYYVACDCRMKRYDLDTK